MRKAFQGIGIRPGNRLMAHCARCEASIRQFQVPMRRALAKPILEFLYPPSRLHSCYKSSGINSIQPHRSFNTSTQWKKADEEYSTEPIQPSRYDKTAVARVADMISQLPSHRDELFDNRLANSIQKLIEQNGLQYLSWEEMLQPLLEWIPTRTSATMPILALRLAMHISSYDSMASQSTSLQNAILYGLANIPNYQLVTKLVVEALKNGSHIPCEMMVEIFIRRENYRMALHFYELRLRYSNIPSPMITRRDALITLIKEKAPEQVDLVSLLRKLIREDIGNPRSLRLFASRLFMYYYRQKESDTAIDILELSAASGLVLDPDVYTAGFRIYKEQGDSKYAVDLLETLDYFGIAPSIYFYNSAMSVKYQQRYSEDVEKLFQTLKEKRLKPDEKTYNFLLHAFARRGEIKRVILLFNEVQRELGFVNEYHYSAVLLAAGISQNRKLLLEWFNRLQEDENVVVNVLHYNIMIDACARTIDAEGAMNLLEEMLSRGVEPNVYTWTTVIALYSYRHDSDTAQNIFDRMEASGIQPDIVTYGALMNAYVNCEKMHAALLILDEVEASELETSSVIYNILLKGYALTRNITGVRRVFDHMQHLGLQPDLYTYTGIINALCEQGSVAEADGVLQKMIQERVNPNVYTYSALMNGHLRIGNGERAREIYAEMLERGIKPSYVTFSILNAAYSGEGSSEEGLASAEQILKSLIMEAQEAEKAGMLSTSSTSPVLGSGALDISVSDLEQNALTTLQGRIPTDIFNPIINAYGKRYRPDLARNLYNIMLELGTLPDAQTYTILMNAYRLGQDFEGVRDTWRNVLQTVDRDSGSNLVETMEDLSSKDLDGPVLQNLEDETSSIPPSQVDAMRYPLSIYAEALESAHLYEEILRAWNAVIKCGFRPDAQNWNQLARALIGAGRIEEACQVLDRHLFPARPATNNVDDDNDVSLSSGEDTATMPLTRPNQEIWWSPYFAHEATMAMLEIAMEDLHRGRLEFGGDASKLLIDPKETEELPLDPKIAAQTVFSTLQKRYPRIMDALITRRTESIGKAVRNRFTGQA